METNKSLAHEVEAALASGVAALTLIGGAGSAEQAEALLDRVLKPFPLSPHHPHAVLRLLRSLYGGSTEQKRRYLEPLQPDLLGEDLVAEILLQDGELLDRVLDEGSPEEGYSTLTVLARLARRRPDLQRWLGVAPSAFVSLMSTMVRNYVEYAEPAGKKPDEALLAPHRGSIPIPLAFQRPED